MINNTNSATNRQMSSIFERYLTLWVGLCIIAGILIGKIAPSLARTLDSMSITANGAPVVSIPIAVCLFFMMYPIMVKIDFSKVIKAGKNGKPVFLTLFLLCMVSLFCFWELFSIDLLALMPPIS